MLNRWLEGMSPRPQTSAFEVPRAKKAPWSLRSHRGRQPAWDDNRSYPLREKSGEHVSTLTD